MRSLNLVKNSVRIEGVELSSKSVRLNIPRSEREITCSTVQQSEVLFADRGSD